MTNSMMFNTQREHDMFSSKIEEIGETSPEKEDAEATMIEDTIHETEMT